MKRLYRFLRSPKLAIALILGIGAYAVLGTVVPQPALGPEEVARWSTANPLAAAVAGPLGLFSAFTSPVFLAAVLLLGASTIACAISRTKAARSVARTGEVTESLLGALKRRPTAATADMSVSESETAFSSIARLLAEDGFSVKRGPNLLEATKFTWGAFGSPVFHWSLAALIVVCVAGVATRAEGTINIPVGGSVIDDVAAYAGSEHRGPLYPGHTGLELRAREFQTTTVIDGIDRAHSAVVEVYRGGAKIAERRVYPNSPLRTGRLLIHRTSEWGYAPRLEVVAPDGSVVAQTSAFIPVSTLTSAGAGPVDLDYNDATGTPYVLKVSIPAGGTDASGTRTLQKALLVEVTGAGGVAGPPVRIDEGASGELPGGASLRFVSRAQYINVSVADDWSVPFIYALFVLAALGLVVAVLFSPKKVWVLLSHEDGVGRIRVLARHLRGDPNFPEHVVGIVREAVPETVEVEEACPQKQS